MFSLAVMRFLVLQFGAEFSTLTISGPAVQSRSPVISSPAVQSRSPVISSPAVQSRSPAFSSPVVQSRSPAFSSPVVWCRIFQSRVFSSPGNSNAYVNKVTLCLELG